MSSKKRQSHSETRKDEHLRLLEELENLTLTDSCCEICHCDCYSSHGSSNFNELFEDFDETHVLRPLPLNTNNSDNNNKGKKKPTTLRNKGKKKKCASNVPPTTPTLSPVAKLPVTKAATLCKKVALPEKLTKVALKRSRSTSSIPLQVSTHNARDCEILQDLLSSFGHTPPKLQVTNKSSSKPEVSQSHMSTSTLKLPPWPSLSPLPSTSKDAAASLKLCDSMANLCLAPVVRQAYQQVPTHDKKILNRMATKRSEKAMAKENAWLARKYWENERYERELLKCEQMEEYKRAVRDKQFQDYLMTKARLNEIAQRDLAELQRLRESLQQKDERTKRRLDTVRVERDILLCQRRCDELCKSEAVTVQQEEQHLDEALRKQEACHRLTERLQRADQIRNDMLDSYLKRLRYDNYIEKLLHEENWRDVQQFQLHKRAQLQEHISRKRSKSQRFVEHRQRRNETLTKNAKISASLRELVRSSVTPEGALLSQAAIPPVPLELGRLLIDRPITKLSIQEL